MLGRSWQRDQGNELGDETIDKKTSPSRRPSSSSGAPTPGPRSAWLSDVPELAESLTRTDPGELLASGAFNEGFRGERPEAAE